MPDGAKETIIATDVPGETFNPFDMPLMEKPGPTIVTFETVMLEVLVFVNVTPRVLAAPTLTLPKPRVEVLAFRPEMTFDDADLEALTVPLHPDWPMTASRSAVTERRARFLLLPSRALRLYTRACPWAWAIIEPKILAQPPDCYCP